MSVLCDTDWFVDYLASRPAALRLIEPIIPSGVAISLITLGESYDGILNQPLADMREQRLLAVLEQFVVIPLDQSTMRIYGEIRGRLRRQGNIIGDNDLLIAATARRHDLTPGDPQPPPLRPHPRPAHPRRGGLSAWRDTEDRLWRSGKRHVHGGTNMVAERKIIDLEDAPELDGLARELERHPGGVKLRRGGQVIATVMGEPHDDTSREAVIRPLSESDVERIASIVDSMADNLDADEMHRIVDESRQFSIEEQRRRLNRSHPDRRSH